MFSWYFLEVSLLILLCFLQAWFFSNTLTVASRIILKDPKELLIDLENLLWEKRMYTWLSKILRNSWLKSRDPPWEAHLILLYLNLLASNYKNRNSWLRRSKLQIQSEQQFLSIQVNLRQLHKQDLKVV